jgi:hypothetical protein
MGKGGSSFLTSLPGMVTAVGTLVAACAGLIALFVTTNGGQPSPSTSVAPLATTSTISSGNTGGGGGSTSGGNPGGGSGGSGNTGGASIAGGSGGSGSGNGGSSSGNGGSGSGSQGGNTGGSGAPAISAVSFTGDTADPTVTVSGSGFGTSPPPGQSDDSTSCGSYTSNGDDYGAMNLWFEDTGNFAAGNGTPPNGSCIGITVLSWSDNQVIYQFGNAYDSFDHWYLSAGDQYIVSVMGVEVTGTVGFS